MKAQLKVNRIEWMSQEEELTLTVVEQNGLMSYNSRMFLPASSLNALISELQRQTPELDLLSCLTIEQWSESEVNYVFDLTNMGHSNYFLEGVQAGTTARQIRA